MNDTLRIIKERRTTRRFKPEQLKDEDLQAIIEAGLYAPSAHNEQSWHFTVIQNADLIRELNLETKNAGKNSPVEFIRRMSNNEQLDIFYGAPTIIIVSGQDDALMPEVDCAAATENMFIAAESLEVGGCWNGLVAILFKEPLVEEYKRKLHIPEGYTPYYAAVFGYKEKKISRALPRKENKVQYIR